MNILSIDVGMKNLAYCLLEYNKKDNIYKILKWEVINLCKSNEHICMGVNKKKKKCIKKASFFKENKYYCKIHAKNKEYKIPCDKFKLNKLKKCKIIELKQLAYDYNIKLNINSKKQECFDSIIKDISNNYFNHITNEKTTDKTLVDYGIQLKKEFENKLKDDKIDLILIENQIGPLALRMKCLQGMIMQHFIEKNINNIIPISASNKLKEFLGKKKTTYSERKKASIDITTKILIENNYINKWYDFFIKHKKKDDLADCFLQVKWYIQK